MLTIGIPRETKAGEKLVGLTPAGAAVLEKAGVSVCVEKGAGEAAGFKDEDFKQAGAEIVPKASELYRRNRLIQKVKEPLASEFEFLSRHHILFCFLHLASPQNRTLTEVLLRGGLTALGFETVEKEGRTLLLEPMSRIAGTLAAYFAAFFSQTVGQKEGKIVCPAGVLEKLEGLAAQYPGIPTGLPPIKAVVYGGGTAGRNAARMVLQMEGEVDLVEKREERRDELLSEFRPYGNRIRIGAVEGLSPSPPPSPQRGEGRVRGRDRSLFDALAQAGVWIGCVHLAGKRAPLVLTPEEVGRLSQKKKKIIIDIAVDQGGNFPGTRPTTYGDPLFLDEFGNFRFGVTNVPSLCGRGASEAMERAVLPYTLRLAREGLTAFKALPELKKGVQIYQGKLVNEAVGEAHGFEWRALEL